jgi:EPS-associated MarR family transcriptional regulator
MPDSSPIADRALLDVIRELDARPQSSQRQLASSLGMSLGKVNYCLRALIARGLVKAQNYKNSRNTAAYLYLMTPSGIAAKAEMTRRFLVQKRREFDALRLEIERLQEESDAASHHGSASDLARREAAQ